MGGGYFQSIEREDRRLEKSVCQGAFPKRSPKTGLLERIWNEVSENSALELTRPSSPHPPPPPSACLNL